MKITFILHLHLLLYYSMMAIPAHNPFKVIGKSSDEIDSLHMRRAVFLASQASGRTSPNPCVGCVVLDKNGTVVGEGWHRKAGEAHAEVDALRNVGNRAQGGTAYVSLEPCNHFGRTPPCTQALLR